MVEPPRDQADDPDEAPTQATPRRRSPFPNRDSPWQGEAARRTSASTPAVEPNGGLVGDAMVGCLAALAGGIVGAVLAFAATYALLSGQEVNALVWAVTLVFFCVFAIPLGAGAAAGLSGHIRGRNRKTKPS